jgi:hypothetical protein
MRDPTINHGAISFRPEGLAAARLRIEKADRIHPRRPQSVECTGTRTTRQRTASFRPVAGASDTTGLKACPRKADGHGTRPGDPGARSSAKNSARSTAGVRSVKRPRHPASLAPRG